MTRLLALALAAALGSGTTAHADPRAEIDAIRALGTKWIEAIAAKDVTWIANLYTEDGKLMAPGAPVAEGREAIGEAWKSMVAAPGPALTFAPTAIHLAGSLNYAYEIGTWKTGDADQGSYVLIWRKPPGSPEWKVVADIFNSTRPAPAAPAP